jgi:sulfhydrogenase subunit beta (sulfur reductase)
MDEKIITKENLKAICSELLKNNVDVISPLEKGYLKLKSGDELTLDSKAKHTKASFKEYVFPKTEPIIFYKKSQSDVELLDVKMEDKRTVIFGAKPCDVRSISILSKVFNWDYKDEFFNVRTNNTITIGIMCQFCDDFCFCTSVGLSPISSEGSDIFLIPLDENNFALRVITPKGEEFIKPFGKYLMDGIKEKSEAAEKNVKFPEKVFDSEKVKEWITNNFENEYWDTIGKMCLGCAQCAFVCPVCHCFDIVDEDYNYTEGRRMKNWDGCQFDMFTLHASGHNPRDNQNKRYRQRISHKFKYYPDKFNEILCTGCGRCSRGCPVSMDIKEIVTGIGELAKK